MGSTSSFGEYLRLCARRSKILAYILIAAFIVVFIYTFMVSSTTYVATTSIIIKSTTGAQTLADQYQQSQLTKEIAKNCIDIITNSSTVGTALEREKLDDKPNKFAKNITVEQMNDSSVLRINVKYKDSDVQAIAFAKTLTDVICERIEEEYTELGASEPTYTAHSLETATIAKETPRIVPAIINALISLAVVLIGFLLFNAVAVAVDKTIRSHDKISRTTDKTVIAAIPSKSRGTSADVNGVKVSNAYRILRSAVKYAPNKPKSIAVCSPSPKDGRTSVAIGLATALAETNAMVLLIEADLRRPGMKMQMRIDSPFGLADLLLGKTNLATTISKTSNRNLYVITASGTTNISNIEISDLLDSDVTDELLEAVYAQFDYIILDTPAVAIVPDATSVSGKVDGCVVVSQYGHTRSDELKSTIEILEGTGANILGIVTTNSAQRSGFFGSISNYYTNARTLERRVGLQ